MSALSCVLLAATLAGSPSDEPSSDQVRQAVQRSISYIQDRGVWWIQGKKCVSCHRVNTMVWSLATARRNGFQVSDQLDEWLTWAIDTSLSKNDTGKVVGLGNKEGVAQILLTLNREAGRDHTRKELASLLLNGQQANGSWKPGGQLPSQKRPKSETESVSTMWITLALIGDGEDEKAAAAVERAMRYIENSSAGVSTEWHVVRLLLAVERNDRQSSERLLEGLREQQQSDGGWGWLVSEKSDALGTGMTMYALIRAGLSRDDTSIKRAQQFLIDTQREEGSWAVNGTKANKKDKVQETAAYWGTTWASLGMMATLRSGENEE